MGTRRPAWKEREGAEGRGDGGELLQLQVGGRVCLEGEGDDQLFYLEEEGDGQHVCLHSEGDGQLFCLVEGGDGQHVCVQGEGDDQEV